MGGDKLGATLADQEESRNRERFAHPVAEKGRGQGQFTVVEELVVDRAAETEEQAEDRVVEKSLPFARR